MKYVIRHERNGVYIDDQTVPRFSWTAGKADGRRFETQAEAKSFIHEHFEPAVAGRCAVVEVTEGES